MKAVVTIEIYDKTTKEKLNEIGMSENALAYLYRNAFDELVREALSPDCEATVNCVVTDNTKEEIDFDYEAEVE